MWLSIASPEYMICCSTSSALIIGFITMTYSIKITSFAMCCASYCAGNTGLFLLEALLFYILSHLLGTPNGHDQQWGLNPIQCIQSSIYSSLSFLIFMMFSVLLRKFVPPGGAAKSTKAPPLSEIQMH